MKCGAGNFFGNKGGVGIGFEVGNTRLGFVSTHFAAHYDKADARNENFHRINGEMKLRQTSSNKMLSEQFDHLFWMGDLNYRVFGNRNIINHCLENKYYGKFFI